MFIIQSARRWKDIIISYNYYFSKKKKTSKIITRRRRLSCLSSHLKPFMSTHKYYGNLNRWKLTLFFIEFLNETNIFFSTHHWVMNTIDSKRIHRLNQTKKLVYAYDKTFSLLLDCCFWVICFVRCTFLIYDFYYKR